MRTQALGIITAKEFRDHLKSRRFLTILAVFLIVASLGMIAGTVQYQKDLDEYNEAQVLASGEEESVNTRYAPSSSRPSIMKVFEQIGSMTVNIGSFLGLAMGFDLVTREKESKSLKMLLSHPIFRNEVITGKLLGGAAAIALAGAITVGIALAVLLIGGIVLSSVEMMKVLLFGVFTFLFIFSPFVVALFFSTVAKNSGMALVASLALVVVTVLVIPLIFNIPMVTETILGEPPEFPEEANAEEIAEYEKQMQAYYDARTTLRRTVMLISPSWNYDQILETMIPDNRNRDDISDDTDEPGISAIFEMIADLSHHLIALLVIPAAFFGLAWVKFAREDIR